MTKKKVILQIRIGALILAMTCSSCATQAQFKTEVHVSSELLQLLDEYEAYVESGRPIGDFTPADSALSVEDGSVLVDATSNSDGQQLLAALNEQGFKEGSAFGRLVSGWLPIPQIRTLADLEDLKSARAAAMSTGPGR